LAADALNESWDKWMKDMSASYSDTLNFIESGKIELAATRFAEKFQSSAKDLYTQSGTVYPPKYSNVNDWCAWTKELYKLTSQTNKALEEKDAKCARELLQKLRIHMFNMHAEAKAMKSNDYIFAFQIEASKDQPSAKILSKFLELTLGAEPSAEASQETDLYAKARTEWSEAVSTILKDDKIEEAERAPLLSATDGFYQKYGIQFE
jgi:hypothetical protein